MTFKGKKMAKQVYVPVVDKALCKGCGLCIAFCPVQVYEADFEGKCILAHPERCVGCMACDYRCPDFAIRIMIKDER